MVDLKKYAYLSIVAAVSTMALKVGAYLVTDSISLLSDACESVVNLVAALFALFSIYLASQPEDKEHAYGHNKVEYFSSGIEGVLILIAAFCIIWVAVDRIINPVEIRQIGLGTIISICASLINFVVARILLKAGGKYNSIILEADSKHLMSDVWTSVAVVLGVIAVSLTGIMKLDPIIAIIVALNIVRSGYELIKRSSLGLMDTSLCEDDIKKIEDVFNSYIDKGVAFHALRTRQSGVRRFISFHVLVPGEWNVSKAHSFVEDVEKKIRNLIPMSHIDTHIEPIEDESAYQDMALDREK